MSNFNKFKKKYVIKVPKNIQTLYCDKKNILTFVGPLQTRSLKLSLKIVLTPKSSLIAVTSLPISVSLVNNLKNLKKLQGTTTAKIRQMLIETSYLLYQKLNLVGVGYRVFPYENLENQLYFKLGYSHLVYFKVASSVQTRCQKFTKLFLFGNCSFNNLTEIAAQIRACKFPEPYKGKGILYEHEKIQLKKGKKI